MPNHFTKSGKKMPIFVLCIVLILILGGVGITAIWRSSCVRIATPSDFENFCFTSEKNGPVLTFEGNSTYNLFLSYEASIVPRGYFIIDGDLLKLSTDEVTDAFVFRITKSEGGDLLLTYMDSLSQSRLLNSRGIADGTIFKNRVDI